MDEARVPAGSPDGGQWTSGGGVSARVDESNKLYASLTKKQQGIG